jgi:Mn-dependent DtxR family transcriptional regulator
MTTNREDYLKQLYRLEKAEGSVTTSGFRRLWASPRLR